MNEINRYLDGIKSRYPDTQAVREQLEELRDTLHLKTEEYQAQGMAYEKAAQSAIESLGDVTPLLEQVSGNMRAVHINRLSRSNALLCSACILGEFLICWLVVLLAGGASSVFMQNPGGVIMPFIYSLLALLLGICIWPAIACINYRRDPQKTEVVDVPYRRLMRTALIGWLLISAALFTVNALTGAPVWFAWPTIGVANWPLNIFLYHRQLLGGRYDA